MNNDWKPLTIKVRTLEDKIKKGLIQVPTYQRGVVWNEKKQIELIESIKLGYPFGSLIIFKYDDNTKPELLIDGLQRSTSLFNFINNPSKFFDEKDIEEKILDELVNKINNMGSIAGQKNVIKNKIIEWVHSFKTSSEVREMDHTLCAQEIISLFPTLDKSFEELNEISRIIKPIFDNFKKVCDMIEEKEVPYIEIVGDDSNLAEIFYRINDRGVKLTKQNIFAATWANTPVKITNKNLSVLVEIVKNRYDYIEKNGTKIYGYKSGEFLRKSELDVFELSYAFGKHISKEFPELFKYKDDPIGVDSIGFVLINACLMGSKDNLKKMNELLRDRLKEEDVNEFLIKIISCINYVDELLAPVTKFKGNKRFNKAPLHTDFQIVSIIASIFRLKHVHKENEKYILDVKNINKNWNHYDVLLRQNMLKKYIYDIIYGSWSGHGDNSLDTIIFDNPEIYTTDINRSEFERMLYSWYTKILSERKELKAKDIKSPAEAEKVLLNLIYADSFSAKDQLNIEKFDIEHLATKKLMEKKLNMYNGALRLPISSIANLCLLPEYTNRKKQDHIIYDDDIYINKIGKQLSIQEIEEKFTFTTEHDFDWLNGNKTIKDFENGYLEFLNSRFKTLLDKILSILYN